MDSNNGTSGKQATIDNRPYIVEEPRESPAPSGVNSIDPEPLSHDPAGVVTSCGDAKFSSTEIKQPTYEYGVSQKERTPAPSGGQRLISEAKRKFPVISLICQRELFLLEVNNNGY